MQHFDTRCNFYFGTQWVENVSEEVLLLKFVYSEKATKFCEIFTSHHSKIQKDGWTKYVPNFDFK